jgi:hypothetical protein
LQKLKQFAPRKIPLRRRNGHFGSKGQTIRKHSRHL